MDKKFGCNCSEGAIKFSTLLGVGHEIDLQGIHGLSFGGIENQSVFLAFYDQVIPW